MPLGPPDNKYQCKLASCCCSQYADENGTKVAAAPQLNATREPALAWYHICTGLTVLVKISECCCSELLNRDVVDTLLALWAAEYGHWVLSCGHLDD